jgi:hypothetical protein
MQVDEKPQKKESKRKDKEFADKPQDQAEQTQTIE